MQIYGPCDIGFMLTYVYNGVGCVNDAQKMISTYLLTYENFSVDNAHSTCKTVCYVVVCSSSVRAFLSLDTSRQSTTTDDGSDEAYSSQVRILVYVAASNCIPTVRHSLLVTWAYI